MTTDSPRYDNHKTRSTGILDPGDWFRVLSASLPVGVFQTDLKGRNVYSNPRWEELSGQTTDESLGEGWSKAIHPDDRTAVLAEWQRFVDGGSTYSREYRLLRPDGEIRWVHTRAAPIRLESGDVVGIAGTIEDITERKHAEAALRDSEQRYRRIFDATSDGLIINDPDTGIVVEANSAVCAMHGYTHEEFIGLHPTRFIHPDFHSHLQRFLEAVRSGGTLAARAIDVRKDGGTFYVDVFGTQIIYQGRPHVLGIVRDVTQHVAAYQTLERRVEERTQELSALVDIARSAASTLELKPLMGLILDQFTTTIGCASAMIIVIEGKRLRILDYRGPLPGDKLVALSLELDELAAYKEVARKRAPVIVDDTRGDSPLARLFQVYVNERVKRVQETFSYARSWMGVPLLAKDRVVGFLRLDHTEPNYFTREHARLAQAMADQAAMAIENARLYERAERRAREVEALYRADEALYRSLRLEDVLQALVDVATDILQADKATVLIWDAEHEHLVVGAARGFDPASLAKMRHAPGQGVTAWVAENALPAVVEDARADPRVAHHITDPEGIRSLLHVPIIVGGEVFGVFGVNYCQVHSFTGDEERLLLDLAQRAALAIENVHLYERAQELAALKERQRLARELHDSVSQALYGIALGARTARTLLDRDPRRAAEPLDYVLSLADAGLAEMRALIFELRPESLQQEGLVAALSKLAAALRARHQIDVQASLGDEPDVSFEIKETAYRIAQEALHNVVKHAHATRVEVSLEIAPPNLVLEVRDNGVGFDPNQTFPGHFGLQSMRDRASRHGGTARLESAPGQGARVYAWLPLELGAGDRNS